MKLPKEGNITLISIKKCGVTLVELMIVVAIIAIIVSIAYPSYQNHITKTRRADGQGMLLRVMQEQRKHFSNENTYTTDLIGDLGFDVMKTAKNGGCGAVREVVEYLLKARL